YPPVSPHVADSQSWSLYLTWWREDAFAAHVLTARLTQNILAFLPDHHDRLTGLPRTSRAILSAIKKFCNMDNPANASALKEALFARTCGISPTSISSFCEAWRSDIGSLRSMGYSFDWPDAIISFLAQLP
ncbi:hypothetical protein K435DRAFT_558752, partial [Dendrothele bispora CBS 962.96]